MHGKRSKKPQLSTRHDRPVTRSMTMSPPANKEDPSSVPMNEAPSQRKAPRMPHSSSSVPGHLRSRPQSWHSFPSISANTFGIIQETIAHDLYFLVIQAVLWNQTSGIQAWPVFYAMIERYPDPKHLAKASLPELTALLRPLGLHNRRARRCIALALHWSEDPPTAKQTYLRKGYPAQPLAANTREGYEIAHLPGVGPYALDSFRIFHRDEMRGLADDWLGTGATVEGFEPEWKRVLPLDKELRAYLRWRWLKEGFLWDDESGHCHRLPA